MSLRLPVTVALISKNVLLSITPLRCSRSAIWPVFAPAGTVTWTAPLPSPWKGWKTPLIT